jgi:hypothetical protein
LKECTVSIVGQDGRTYETTVEASSLFDAAARALEQWSQITVRSHPTARTMRYSPRLWWYRHDAVVEVRMGDKCWKVNAERVREWRWGR